MITVTVMYPNTPGSKFDMDYYLGPHFDLVGRLWGDRLASARAVKGVATRRRERFGWRHRAGLGGACFGVFSVYVWTQRSSASLPATLAASMAFYLYAAASYLPPQPEADGPEITGAREWPALRVWLKPFLLDAVEAYLGLEVVRDAPATRARP